MADVNKDRLVKIVDLNAPISRVWKALTDYKAFGEWFRVDLDQPFKVGSKSTGQITYPGHKGVAWLAFIESVDHERIFSFRWFDSEDPEATQNQEKPSLLVEFRLEETPAGTRLTITESGFSALAEPRRTELMRGNEEGWNIQTGHIAEYLSD